jgi:DNA-binding MarR family transcriptional regulator
VISENGKSGSVLALHRATHRTLAALGAAVADLGLTASELNVLANLADGRNRNVRELSTETGTRASTLTGVLDRLERRGYLTRELDLEDRRSFRLPLTASGEAVAARIGGAIAELEEAALADLSARQLAGYHAVLFALEVVSA